MPDENRVFDVTKPKNVSPSATSKPVIVGHQPIVSDPMVRDDSEHAGVKEPDTPEPTRIQVTDESPPAEPIETGSQVAEESPLPSDNEPMAGGSFSNNITPPSHETADSSADTPGSPAVYETSDEPGGLSEAETPAPAETPPADDSFGPPADDTPSEEPQPDTPAVKPDEQPIPHIEGLHFSQPPRKRNWLKIFIPVILALLIGAYLAIDSGLVNAGFNLPFHIFKQKSTPATSDTGSTNANKPQPAAGPTVPSGFKAYKIAGTSLTFAAPITWGDPTSNTEPGFSKRGANIQSDGTYAYLVDFATNKDVEIAVTSSKYLPAARTTLYYDYLQWCTGTNDGNTYESILHFSTANKIDTPTTITCDQGPVPGATKLDSSTIVQAKAQDTSNKVIGDIYTKNISDSSLVVFRVKDTVMTNGDSIKQLLNTVQVSSSSSTSTGSTTGQ